MTQLLKVGTSNLSIRSLDYMNLKKVVIDQIGYTNGDKLLVATRGYQ